MILAGARHPGRGRRRACSRFRKPSCWKVFHPRNAALAMAVFALGVVVAPVLGPTLGGWLTDTYSWRWAFYINIPDRHPRRSS